jgi:hypothetical protein
MIWLIAGMAWLLVSAVFALGVGRWFRFMREAERDW